MIEYTLGNLWRQLVLLKQIKSWSLTSLEQRLVKLRRMEAYRCQPGRRGETNLDDGGELTRGCPRRCFENGAKDRERRQMPVYWSAAERQNGNSG